MSEAQRSPASGTTVEEIAERLRAIGPFERLCGRRAAVIALLVPDAAAGLVVPFTRRSYHLRLHPGEIGLPGGSWECGDGEDLARTALRELREELGVEPEGVTILGRLPDVSTVVTDFSIAPFVGYLARRQAWRCSDGEVDAIIEIPLREILRPGAVRYATVVTDGCERNVIAMDYGPHHVWGATGRILRELVNALGDRLYHVPESIVL